MTDPVQGAAVCRPATVQKVSVHALHDHVMPGAMMRWTPSVGTACSWTAPEGAPWRAPTREAAASRATVSTSPR
uniref:Uncharacterized protein n=1 Tax=Arundo donax TaxID=35708 RepID=A0A0A8Z2U8_ARUDO